MADSEVRQKEWTILETERMIRKIEQCEGMPAKLILMRHFYDAGMRAGEIAMREKAAGLANSCAEILSPEQTVGARWIGDKIRQLAISGAEESKNCKEG